jgi:hypothetical protein
MLRMHQGRLDEAAELFAQARLQAQREADPMGEFQALEHLVVLRQQQKAWDDASRLGSELEELGGKLRAGSEGPFARALLALSRYARGEEGAGLALDAALEELRVADAKARLAYTLTRAAQLDLARGDGRLARARAEEARRTAGALGRPSEILRAAVTLVRACREEGDEAAAEAVLREIGPGILPGAAADARRELDAVREGGRP